MEHSEIAKTPETLLKITRIIETECAGDASFLLSEGFVLLGVGKSIFEDSENRFVYSLGFPKPLSQLSDSVLNNF
ncbi:hypothetical protein [Thalassomonas haliotis]|uniref:Uncharacterized protein n=1 Tax=Thalassomonas haliotis TaxID=485448 RepID=A0ABY7VAK9_9GAMM|nr:hypothetical protein [Thalassomonas haliotis]WDE10270.1 hypothetical protein H3N35_18575 [Thalassomonas haliotis]